MGLLDQFKDGAKETGSGLGKILGASGKAIVKAGATALKGTATVAKFVGNAALDAILTSNENSELVYHYDARLGGNYSRFECRDVLGRTLLELTMRRSRDSYLKLILSTCERVDLEGGAGHLIYDKDFRGLCARILDGNEDALQEIVKLAENKNLKEDDITAALDGYKRLFAKGRTYGSYIREVFVVSVGEDIKEFVYNDEGEVMRDANGTSVEKVVGTNYGVAVFKVTFSSGHKLKLKVYLDDGEWYGLEPHKYI